MNPVLGKGTADQRVLPAWVGRRRTDKMTAALPSRRAVTMLLPYTLPGDLANEVKRQR
jgi:hypothetical protein